MVERGKIGKDGKEGEVQGDEMERREQKGENGQVMGGMTLLVWALWRATVCVKCVDLEGGERRVT